MNDFALKEGAPSACSTVYPSWVTCEELGVFPGVSIARLVVESFALWSTYDTRVRSQRRAADWTSVSSTARRSKAERLITFSTSAVAVCCCRDLRSSLSSRAFSMAITAWSAKVVTSPISRSANGSTRLRESPMTSSHPKVFFGGDAAFGPKNIIWAVAHGHDAAISIDRMCRGADVNIRPAPQVAVLSQKMGIHEWSYDNEITLDRR